MYSTKEQAAALDGYMMSELAPIASGIIKACYMMVKRNLFTVY
jgi:hypothetical protein